MIFEHAILLVQGILDPWAGPAHPYHRQHHLHRGQPLQLPPLTGLHRVSGFISAAFVLEA